MDIVREEVPSVEERRESAMRNNLQSVYEKMKTLDTQDTGYVSMQNMLKELTEHSFRGYANIEERMILLDYSSDLFNGRIEMEFDMRRECLVTRLVFPIRCSRLMRQKVIELFHMLNCGHLLGVFEYDMRDGECAYKYVHYYGDNAMTQRQARQAVGTTISMLRRYEDTLVPLLSGYEPDEEKECAEYGALRNRQNTPAAAEREEASTVSAVKEALSETPDATEQTADESGLRPDEQENNAGNIAADTTENTAESTTENTTEKKDEQRNSEPQTSSPLSFEVDNEEMLRLFNDACTQSRAGRSGRGAVEPTPGSEADEEREIGGISVEPEPADDIPLEPGEMAIAFNDSGEMVRLITGIGMVDGETDEEEQDDGPQNDEADETLPERMEDADAADEEAQAESTDEEASGQAEAE